MYVYWTLFPEISENSNCVGVCWNRSRKASQYLRMKWQFYSHSTLQYVTLNIKDKKIKTCMALLCLKVIKNNKKDFIKK